MNRIALARELTRIAEEVLDLHGTKKHHITEQQAESDALKLSKKWGKPFYVYYNEAAGTWNYGSEEPNPKWTKKVRQVTARARRR